MDASLYRAYDDVDGSLCPSLEFVVYWQCGTDEPWFCGLAGTELLDLRTEWIDSILTTFEGILASIHGASCTSRFLLTEALSAWVEFVR